jgi:putative spermidine/putrescine transport system permease protein
MTESRGTRVALRFVAVLVLLFLYIPLALIVLYAFNASRLQSWPIEGLSLKWFRSAAGNDDIRRAIWLSVRAGLLATGIALLLGSALAFAVHRFRFFGREAVSFLVVLPIALPGIVTGMALRSAFNTASIDFSLMTIVVGHATFCIVIVYNNVVARLRRVSHTLEEASMDLGADTWQTFRYVTLPSIGTALVAGALLAFALSFDEVIVTIFTAGSEETLPIWIFNSLRLPNARPEVNVVAVVIILLTTIPVYFAQRLAGAGGRADRL